MAWEAVCLEFEQARLSAIDRILSRPALQKNDEQAKALRRRAWKRLSLREIAKRYAHDGPGFEKYLRGKAGIPPGALIASVKHLTTRFADNDAMIAWALSSSEPPMLDKKGNAYILIDVVARAYTTLRTGKPHSLEYEPGTYQRSDGNEARTWVRRVKHLRRRTSSDLVGEQRITASELQLERFMASEQDSGDVSSRINLAKSAIALLKEKLKPFEAPRGRPRKSASG